MFLVDSHSHSSCSPDGSASMVEMARGALRAGLSALCITDHCDLISLDGTQRITSYDWAPLLSEWEEVKRAYGDRIELLLGVELGMAQIDPETAQRIISEPGAELDFVLGAIHNFSEKRGGRDFYFTEYHNQADCYDALDDYFESMELLANTDVYDALAHLTYPLRYMTGGPYEPPTLSRYDAQLRRILTAAAQAGKGIELNTWKGKDIADWAPVLKLFRACGGEIVTVGSDAHDPDSLGLGIREAYTLLREMGFRYVTSYRRREPHFIKLP